MRDDFKAPKPMPRQQPEPKPEPPKPVKTTDDSDETIVIDDGRPVDEPSKEVKAAPKKSPPTGDQSRWQRIVSWWKALDRNVRFGILAAAFVIFCGIALAIYLFTLPQSSPSLEIKKHPKVAKITTVVSPLSGVQVAPSLAARPVTGIMIENSTWARPQSGLQDAGVIYEAIAEAGITRFLALFQDTTPSYIGPVRSLRPYFIDYAAPYQANIVHVGGSPDALHEVENGQFRNLDEFFNGPYFYRIGSRDAPHNMYTNFNLLDKLEKSKDWTKSSFTPWPRKADAPLKTPTTTSIDLAISSGDYQVHYDYDSKTNTYLRSEGGQPHMEIPSSGSSHQVQLHPKVVIALVVPLGTGQLDSSGAYYSNYDTSGSGIAYVFQDGSLTEGTWTKDGADGQLQLTDEGGHALKLNAGQTWLTLLSGTGQVTYK